MIRPATVADAAAIAQIYNYYITDTTITFEEEPISSDEIAHRMGKVATLGLPWLVAEEGGRITGYAYASRWKERSAYRFICESTVYLDRQAVGHGLGTRLYQALLALLRQQGLHGVMGVIALPNEASVALHEKLGFRQAAHFREVGFKFGHWIDVGYWQAML